MNQMRLLVAGICIVFLSANLNAQTFSFNCTRDTTVPGCAPNPCFTLKAIVPDIHGLTDSYVLNPINSPAAPCLPVYVAPDDPNGTPTGLTIDDRYTGLIDLGFTFPFYGFPYTQVVASTNGVVCFDVSRANAAAQWNIINGTTPQDLPSTFYDPAVIFGPYHDLNPQAPTSPTQRIQYQVVGTAPARRWILSFYRVPLYSGACQSLIENTHQIILYESTGIVEVTVFDKQICNGWNQGRAMIGMQNFAKTKAIMVNGRRASDPPWGTIGMNESYRFVPASGPSLLKRVELFDINGNLIVAGTTNPLANGTVEASFPFICPPPGATTTYIVKSTYEKIDDANAVVYGTDTIRVTKGPPTDLNASAVTTNTPCGPPAGTVTVTVPTGNAPYTYVLDGGAPVVGPSPYTFTGVPAGTHMVVVHDAGGTCSSTILNLNVIQTNALTPQLSNTPTACTGVNNGTITVTIPAGGGTTPPYTCTLDGTVVRVGASPVVFNNLPPGIHTVSVVDAGGCVSGTLQQTILVGAGVQSDAVVTPTSCTGASNGTITMSTSSGVAPFTFQLNAGTPQNSNIFLNLASGSYSVTVRDAAGCSAVVLTTVPPGQPLLTTALANEVSCNGASDGMITVIPPTTGIPPYEYSLDGVTWQLGNIFNALAAGAYTVHYRESNGCSGTTPITVGTPSVLTGGANMIPVVCKGQSNGIIIAGGNGGTAPYEYSIDGGTTWRTTDTFHVAAGVYTVLIRDAHHCQISSNINVTEPVALTASINTNNATCNGGANGLIRVIGGGGNSTYTYSLNGGTAQQGTDFNVIPGNYTVLVQDMLGCSNTYPVTVGLTNDLTFTPQTDPVICEGKSTQLQLASNALQYAWSPATGLSNAAIYNPVANPTVTTQYEVTATYGLCVAKDTVIVHVNAAPIPNAGPDGYICYGQSYQLQGSGGTVFSWTPSGTLSSGSVANPQATPAQTATYTLAVTDANGCKSLTTDDVLVDVTPPIHVSVSPADTIAYNGDQFKITATSGGNLYIWSPATGVSDPNISNPIITVGAVGADVTYKVTASTIAGCKGEAFARVRSYAGPDIYVPSAFTPNGDGKNDKFIPFPVGIKEIRYFRVYNRWGQLVYSTSTLSEGWDGKLGGREQVSGVYVWMVQGVTKSGKLITKQGTVALFR